MLFNSIPFAIFLLVVFIIYWFVTKDRRSQNVLLLIASYFFYSVWNFKFLFLLIFSTLLDYYSGIRISNAVNERNRKAWLFISIGINLGFLAVFKYYNFFTSSFSEALLFLGFKPDFYTLNILLPVGISFYTFHGLSYIIDIYKRRIEPEYNFIDYSVFVSFFPLLVAGPIERATHLLPQIKSDRKFNKKNGIDGLRQILWGLFKKVVIADNCAFYADKIFENYEVQSGSTLALGAIFFAVQIYCDFSGYSDIALGTARLFGIELLKNFSFPYFSRDIAEFWRRWHISLTTWFRDYLYIPLGGSKGGTASKIRNTFIIFLVSGLWHGANWTFIAWGLLNALYFIPLLVFNKNRSNLDTVAKGKLIPSFREIFSIALTFCLTVIAWVFFRSDTVVHAIEFLDRMFTFSLFNTPAFVPWTVILLTIFFFFIEWVGREERFALCHLGLTWPRPLRWAFYYVLIAAIFIYTGKDQQFIYFQF